MAARNGLLVTPHVAPAFVLLTAFVPALGLARREQRVSSFFQPPWLIAILLGAVAGGVRPETAPIQGLSRAEQVGASAFFAVGIALGLALVAATAIELRQVLRLRLAPERAAQWMGYAAGVLSVGLLVHRATAFLVGAAGIPNVPLELPLFAAVLGAGASLGTTRGISGVFGFAGLVGAGLALGFGGHDLPLGNVVVLGSLLLFSVLLLRKASIRFAPFLAALAVSAHGFATGRAMAENVTLPVATAVGAGWFALFVFYAFLRLSEPPLSAAMDRSLRWLGAGAALLAASWRGLEYVRFFGVSVATDAALGLVRIPLLALAFLAAAAIVWPRRRRVLRVRELAIGEREKVAVTGPSGTGKTTLINLLSGLLVPESGSINVLGLELTGLSAEDRQDLRVLKLGLVFQEFELLEYLDVVDNILLPYRITPVLRLDSAAREVGLGDKLSRLPGQLSQGERQRVAVCRALVTRPAAIFGDEPTGNLDAANRDHVTDALFRYSEETGAPIVVVSHDPELVLRFERRVDVTELA